MLAAATLSAFPAASVSLAKLRRPIFARVLARDPPALICIQKWLKKAMDTLQKLKASGGICNVDRIEINQASFLSRQIVYRAREVPDIDHPVALKDKCAPLS